MEKNLQIKILFYYLNMNKSKIIDGHKYCRKCEELLPITEFKPNPKLKSGLHSYCNDCVKFGSTYIKKFQDNRIVNGHKHCSKCRELLPITEFKPNPKIKCGLNSHCNDCIKSSSTYIKKLVSCDVIDGHKHCSKCKKLLPVNMFKKNLKVKSGLYSYCNICNPPRENKPITEKKPLKEKKVLPLKIIDGKCVCRKCEINLPISEFYFENGKIKTTCKMCRNKLNREKYKVWSQTDSGKLSKQKSAERYKEKLSNEFKIIREEKLRLKNEERERLKLKREKVRLEREERERIRLEKSKELEIKKNLVRKTIMDDYGVDTWEEAQRLRKNGIKSKRLKERYENDSLFKFRKLIQNNIRNSFKRKGFSKTSKCCEILGADWDVVKRYFESKFLDGMSWDNQGEWHIDHILPISTAVTEEDVLRLNHYTNLQPLWAEDNIKKSDVLTKESYIKKYFPYSEITVDGGNTEIKFNDEKTIGWGVF